MPIRLSSKLGIVQRRHILQSAARFENQRVGRAIIRDRHLSEFIALRKPHNDIAAMRAERHSAQSQSLAENRCSSSFLPSFAAKSSASLFSNPSPLSLENGILRGSPQARKTSGSTSSSDPASSADCANAPNRRDHGQRERKRKRKPRPDSRLSRGVSDRSGRRCSCEFVDHLMPVQLDFAAFAASDLSSWEGGRPPGMALLARARR